MTDKEIEHKIKKQAEEYVASCKWVEQFDEWYFVDPDGLVAAFVESHIEDVYAVSGYDLKVTRHVLGLDNAKAYAEKIVKRWILS